MPRSRRKRRKDEKGRDPRGIVFVSQCQVERSHNL